MVRTLRFLFILGFLTPTIGHADTLTIGGTGADLGTMKLLLEQFKSSHPGVTSEVLPSLGSTGGVAAVLGGAVDLAVSAHPLKDKERDSGAQAIPYAKTAVVVSTPLGCCQESITSADLVEIYSGRKNTWPDGSLIRLVLRPKSETDTKMLKELAVGMDAALAKARQRPEVPVAYTDQENASILQRMPGGLGTASLSVVLGERRPLRALILDGVAATRETIAAGTYPMVKTLYFVTGPNPEDLVRRFIDFTRSAEGWAILENTGHFPPRESESQ